MQMNILTPWHQSSYEISDNHQNVWDTKVYIEEFSEKKEDMQGFQDVISSITGGDTIQLWLMTDSYAFSKGVLLELDVICKIGESLTLTPIEKKEEEKKEEAKKEEAKESEDKNDDESPDNDVDEGATTIDLFGWDYLAQTCCAFPNLKI